VAKDKRQRSTLFEFPNAIMNHSFFAANNHMIPVPLKNAQGDGIRLKLKGQSSGTKHLHHMK